MTKAAELAKMGEVLTNSQIGGRRNIVYNGAMQVAQRATQVTGISASGYQTVDRFALQIAGRDQAVFTLDQASDAPSGFTKSLKITTTTAESAIDADDLFWVEQRFEGQDVISLKNGLSDAEKVTLSFYVKSSITGTFGLNLYKPENTARVINSTYTISSADTWEFKTVTFDGDTSGGGTNNDNSEGFRVGFMLASGSTYDSTNSTSWANYSTGNWAGGHAQDGVVTTTNATWQLTGVQLEVGSQATPFEHRSFAEELTLCQRYYRLIDDGDNTSAFVNAAVYTASKAYGVIPLSPPMRTTPSLEQVTGSDYMQILSNGAGHTFDSYVLSSGNSTNRFVRFNNNENFSTVTASHSGWFKTANTNAFIALEAEL